jgi:hypothetical protein
MVERIRLTVRGVSIWNSPLLIIQYFILYLFDSVYEFLAGVKKSTVFLTVGLAALGALVYRQDGSHQQFVSQAESLFLWYLSNHLYLGTAGG